MCKASELEKAKAQAVQQSFEIGQIESLNCLMKDKICMHRLSGGARYSTKAYRYILFGSYVVDCPFEYDIEIDKGEGCKNGNVLIQQKYILQISWR